MSKQMLRGIVMTTGRQTHQERWRHKGKWATGPIFNGRTNISGGKWTPSGGQSVQLQVSNSVTNRIGLHQSAVESVPHVSSGLIINSNRQLFALWWSTWLGNSHRSQLDWLFAASSQWPEFRLNFIFGRQSWRWRFNLLLTPPHGVSDERNSSHQFRSITFMRGVVHSQIGCILNKIIGFIGFLFFSDFIFFVRFVRFFRIFSDFFGFFVFCKIFSDS